MQRHIFLAKRSNIIKFQLQSQFQRFLDQTLCVFFTNERYKNISDGVLIRSLGSCSRGGTWEYHGGWAGGGGGQFFSENQPDLLCELLT